MPRTKLDKIFDNQFHEKSYDNSEKLDLHSEFFIESTVLEPDYKITIENLINDIDSIISKKYILYKDTIKIKRINKKDINEIYSHIINKIQDKYSIIDIWYYLSDYFNIDSNKFYENLNDEFKIDLINELNNTTNLLKDRNLNNIF